MKWLPMALLALTRLPVERLLFRKKDPREGIEEFEAAVRAEKKAEVITPSLSLTEPEPGTPIPPVTTVQAEPGAGVSNTDTIAYQKRELAKEILLLEKHLQQKCKILRKACDCCEKHLLPIEGLAQETLGITGDPFYTELVEWVRSITDVTSTAASASGQYDEEYAGLAVKARDFRKRIMGTAAVKALLTPELSEKVSAEIKEIMDRALNKEGGKDDTGEH